MTDMTLGLTSSTHLNANREGRGRLASLLLTSTILGCALPLSSTGAFAQAQPAAAASETVNFQIPAQSLSSAINAFIRQSGWQISYSSALARGKTSAAISGSMTPGVALQRLVAGTGVSVRVRAPGSAALIDPSIAAVDAQIEDGSTVLETITVVGAGNSVTEGTGSYTTGVMNTATPLDLSVRETPQSVSVVTRARMNDSAMVTVEDAVNYTTGMTVTSTSSERHVYNSRGFEVNNITVDGLVTSLDSDVMGTAGVAMYDRIEIVRGATGLLEGAGNPSASVNLVRKRPTDTFQGEVTTSIGRWNDYRGILDVGGPLNDAKTLRGRFVTSLRDSDTFTYGQKREQHLFYGVIEADLTENTTLTFGGYHTKEDSPGADWAGLPTREDGTFYDWDRSARAAPLWTYWNKENASVFAEIVHTFDNEWKAEAKGAYITGKMDMAGTSLYGRESDDTFSWNAATYHYEHDQITLDARARGPVEMFGREHQIAIGANYRHYKADDGPGGWPPEYSYRFDPSDWKNSVDSAIEPGWNSAWSRDSTITQYGIYGTAKISLTDPLNLFVGGRLNWYDYDQTLRSGTWTGVGSYEAKGEVTPYVALTYDVDTNHTVYGSITGIFNPQNYTSASGSLLDPVEGKNYEVGVKGEYLGGRLNASFSVFQIDQTNLADALPSDSCVVTTISCYAPAGKVRSRGFEAEVSGEIADGWRASIGYAFTHAKYVEDSINGSAGDRFGTRTPKHLVTLATVYTFDGALEGLRVGASARIQSRTERSWPEFATTHQPGYAIVNLMAGYSPHDNLDFQLNVNNLFDKVYYRNISLPAEGNQFGEPRSFVLTAKYKF
ncbi:TonB-dependent siderophore receptor [Brucella pseudogrignonensis]|uniref:TonB-dependent siderophore receptor n=1 Tax=Brucella pseudogrignonensis TaxID=419475 RepID=UPI001E5B863B|nr:TonB-dependent siderophore receptor [Brucella pseudogrignonensis]MCD4514351.1 TonB-dependent siderophore receptor [Brucella pseudogrignonensis]